MIIPSRAMIPGTHEANRLSCRTVDTRSIDGVEDTEERGIERHLGQRPGQGGQSDRRLHHPVAHRRPDDGVGLAHRVRPTAQVVGRPPQPGIPVLLVDRRVRSSRERVRLDRAAAPAGLRRSPPSQCPACPGSAPPCSRSRPGTGNSGTGGVGMVGIGTSGRSGKSGSLACPTALALALSDSTAMATARAKSRSRTRLMRLAPRPPEGRLPWCSGRREERDWQSGRRRACQRRPSTSRITNSRGRRSPAPDERVAEDSLVADSGGAPAASAAPSRADVLVLDPPHERRGHEVGDVHAEHVGRGSARPRARRCSTCASPARAG